MSNPKAGFVGIWDSWSKEVACRSAELPEQPPYSFPASLPAALLIRDGEKNVRSPQTGPCGNFALKIFVGWRSCLERGPQEVANHNLGLPVGVRN